MTDDRIDILFRRLVELREAKDIAEKEFENRKREFKEAETDLFELMEDQGLDSLKLDIPGRGTVRFARRETVYGRILDLDAALDAFDNEAISDALTKPGIEKRRLNELVRERMESGQSLPEGVDFYVNRGITISKGRG